MRGLMRRPALLLAVLTALALTPSARAETIAGGLAPSANPTPAAQPAPKGGVMRLYWVKPIVLRGRVIALAGRPLVVRGRVSTYVRGQRAVVKAYRNGKLLFRRSVAIRGVGKGRGGFKVAFRTRRTGRIGVTAVHKRTAEQHGMTAKPRRTRAYRPAARFGQRGVVVDLVQRQLRRLRYAVNRNRRFDGSTARALIAFRKVNGLRRNGTLNRRILHMLIARKGAFRAKYPRHGRHVEADISRQVLALVNPGGRVYKVFHTSSGAPATPTVLGSYRFYRKSYGTNAKGMVHSSYFIRGYAIHGYRSVPVFNASHGCLRVPIPNARFIFRWVRIGQRIDVYR